MDALDFLREPAALAPPVTYQGGKVRLAGEILDRINVQPSQVFYDVCCGSGAVTLALLSRGHAPGRIVMVEAGPWGIFWQSITEGSFSLDVFDRWLAEVPSDLREVKGWLKSVSRERAPREAVPYLFPLLQAGSFGSKPIGWRGERWVTHGWRSYWEPTATSNRRSPVNPMMPMPGTIRKRVEVLVERMSGVTVLHCDAADLVPRDGVVYVDPPYEGTEGYTVDFDPDLPQVYAAQGCDVWVSEGRPVSDQAWCLSRGRSKGGVSGARKKANEEWLSFIPAGGS
jgi:hypothetical protein